MTLATALIDAPSWLLQAYREGRCRGMAELYELRQLHDAAPRTVEELVRHHACRDPAPGADLR